MDEQKVKSDDVILIAQNIREIRMFKEVGQTELVRLLQLHGIFITREAIVKIERGIQHIYASQLRAIKDVLDTIYDELLK